MFFNKKEKNNTSIDRMDNSMYNIYRSNNFYGMFYINTKKYLIISSLIYLFLSNFWLGFFIIFFINLTKWKSVNRADKWKKNLLKKNDIIKEEFSSEIWWCRAELNIYDTYGSIIKDFESIIRYSNNLQYFDFINHGIFSKSQINILNNQKFKNLKKNSIKGQLKTLKTEDLKLINKVKKSQLIYFKTNILKYINNNYNIILLLNKVNFYKKNNFIFFNFNNYNFKVIWWNWFKKIIK
jgi:hypothetical protein